VVAAVVALLLLLERWQMREGEERSRMERERSLWGRGRDRLLVKGEECQTRQESNT
jgi:hypothetical protein